MTYPSRLSGSRYSDAGQAPVTRRSSQSTPRDGATRTPRRGGGTGRSGGRPPSQAQYAFYTDLRHQLISSGHSGNGFPADSDVSDAKELSALIDAAKEALSARRVGGPPPTEKQVKALRSMHRKLAAMDPDQAAKINPVPATRKDASALFDTLRQTIDVVETVNTVHNPAWTPTLKETGNVWSKEDRRDFDRLMVAEAADPRENDPRRGESARIVLPRLWNRASKDERAEMQRRLGDAFNRRSNPIDTDPARKATSPEDALSRLIAATGADATGKVTGEVRTGTDFEDLYRDARDQLAPALAGLPEDSVTRDQVMGMVGRAVHANATNNFRAVDDPDSTDAFAFSQGAQEAEHDFELTVKRAQQAFADAPMYPVPTDSRGMVIDPDTGRAPAAVDGQPGVEPVADRFYMLDGKPCLVVASKTSGKLYAKVRPADGGKGWEYAPGVINRLRDAGRPMSLAEAEELSAHLGYCYVCGRTLTAAASAKAGIGPKCRKRFG